MSSGAGISRSGRAELASVVARGRRLVSVIDILYTPALGGGIRHSAEILAAYVEENDWQTLVEYGDRLGNRAVFKRLGYLLEAAELGRIELVDECQQRIS